MIADPKTLSLADLENYDPAAPPDSPDRRFCCPLPDCVTKPISTAHRSLTANVINGAWQCHRCGAKGKLQEFRSERPALAPTSRRDRGRAALTRLEIKPAQPVQKAPPDPAKEAKWRDQASRSVPLADTPAAPAARYLTGRAIPLDIGTAAQVCYCANWYGRPAVMFAIRDASGEVVAAQGRFIDGKTDPKARTGGLLGQGMFITPGSWDATPRIIAEAPIDALTLAAAGYPAMALCGKELRTWVAKKLTLAPVALAFDADSAGDDAAAQWTAELRRYGAIVTRLRPTNDAKDWNELAMRDGIEAVKTALQSAMRPDVPAVLNRAAKDVYLNIRHEIAAGDPAGRLLPLAREFATKCDLPRGYTDPRDAQAELQLDRVISDLREKSRLTPEIEAALMRWPARTAPNIHETP